MADNLRLNNKESKFYSYLPRSMKLNGDWVEERLLSEYGAVFVASGGVKPPDRVVFRDEAEVTEFQTSVEVVAEWIGGFEIELQRVAMEALLRAVSSAADKGLSVTPRGADSGRRNYEGTVELWLSRVEPGLKHWIVQGRVEQAVADEILSLAPFEQVPRILELEREGIYFAKDLSKSIVYSVAPPGTSQHLSMLALDVNEFDDRTVRALLADHGWYQTVVSDLPHFTYMGRPASQLPSLGLRKVDSAGREFWVPDI